MSGEQYSYARNVPFVSNWPEVESRLALSARAAAARHDRGAGYAVCVGDRRAPRCLLDVVPGGSVRRHDVGPDGGEAVKLSFHAARGQDHLFLRTANVGDELWWFGEKGMVEVVEPAAERRPEVRRRARADVSGHHVARPVFGEYASVTGGPFCAGGDLWVRGVLPRERMVDVTTPVLVWVRDRGIDLRYRELGDRHATFSPWPVPDARRVIRAAGAGWSYTYAKNGVHSLSRDVAGALAELAVLLRQGQLDLHANALYQGEHSRLNIRWISNDVARLRGLALPHAPLLRPADAAGLTEIVAFGLQVTAAFASAVAAGELSPHTGVEVS